MYYKNSTKTDYLLNKIYKSPIIFRLFPQFSKNIRLGLTEPSDIVYI